MKNRKALSVMLAVLLTASMIFTGCGSASGTDSQENQNSSEGQQTQEEQGTEKDNSSAVEGAPELDGLNAVGQIEFDYAECLDIYEYEGGYYFVRVYDDADYLVVPEGKEAPQGLDRNTVVINQPLQNIYLGATATMALFDAIDGMDHITMTSIKESNWTIENAAKAMKDGRIIYAGKYSEPDYELILGNGCDLAIESTMIYHSPEVKEMLEEIGIPVLVDRSSYESNPLGRTEWVKLYGVLTGNVESAEKFFDSQKSNISQLENLENTGKKVAFFYITTDGKAVVRSSSDYVPTMISMAGGVYAFDGVFDENGRTSVSMTMESFYDMAQDADFIIYNASIDGTVKSMNDLLAKDEIFKDFKAVKEGNCYTTGSDMYQRTDVISNMILDFSKVFTGQDTSDLEFLSSLE